jgi:hypothetical protein
MASLIPSGNAAGTGSMTLSAPATNSNQVATLPDATGTVMVSGNMPAFSAYLSANQTVTSTTPTKVALNTKVFDTANAFDATTNYRFQPLVAGYYQCNGTVVGLATTTETVLVVYFYKNGSNYRTGNLISNLAGNTGGSISDLIYFNGSTDYLELWGRVDGTGTCQFQGTSANTSFSGSLVRAA